MVDTTANDNGLSRLAERCCEWSERWFPDAFAFALIAVAVIVVAMAAEGVLWPAERRLQQVVSARESGVPIDGGAVGDGEPVDPAALCLRSGLLGIGLGVGLVAVAVLMVAKP